MDQIVRHSSALCRGCLFFIWIWFIADCRNTEGAVLLDVRTAQEYREGHIPGSINIPLQQLDKAIDAYENKTVPLFVYCHSGARSRQAAAVLQSMGYTNVTNIGGITAYSGKVER